MLNKNITAQINSATAVFHYLIHTRLEDIHVAAQISEPQTTVEYHQKPAMPDELLMENLEASG